MRVDELFESVDGATGLVSADPISNHVATTGLRIAVTRSRVRMIPVVMVMAIAVMILGGKPGWAQTGAAAPAPQMKGMSGQDVARFKQIITGVIQNPSYLTPAVHGEFWRILTKTGATPAQLNAVRESMTGLLTVYYPLFWQDALMSLRNRQPYKSPQRQQYENRLLAQRLITPDMIRTNDSLLANIAAGRPIVVQGKSMSVNEPAIQASLRSFQDTARRVDQLFTPGRR